jgi:3-oxoisoapionate decarboxylase
MTLSHSITRREMLRIVATSAAGTLLFAPRLFAVSPRPKRIGIGMHSYGFHWRAAQNRSPAAKFSDALEFLEYCHGLGAGGVQVTIKSREIQYARQIREKAEAYGMYFEGQLSLPKDEADSGRFEKDLALAKEAGATVVRTACLSGRRYETFHSADEFQRFREQSWKSLTLAEPVLKRQRMRLAVENHKDWLVPELIEILRRVSSEFVGVCVDFGNSIALLENAMEVIEALAPYALTTHIKDMAVQEYEDGFLLSEVPLGEGFLDLKQMISILQKANPAVQFNLEMITRDPLQIPCLTSHYWATMANRGALPLARALHQVKKRSSKNPLPRTTGQSLEQQLKLEDSNVRDSLTFARTNLVL